MDNNDSTQKAYAFSLLRVIFILIAALFLPRVFLMWESKSEPVVTTAIDTAVKTEISVAQKKAIDAKEMQKDSIHAVLYTNHMWKDKDGLGTYELLNKKAIVLDKIVWCGDEMVCQEQASHFPMAPTILDENNRKNSEIRMQAASLCVIDFMISSIEESHSYALLLQLIAHAGQLNKEVLIIDRPNLISTCIEGFTEIPITLSANDANEIPTHNGMTTAELARYFNSYLLPKPAKLTIIPIPGYIRPIQRVSISLCSDMPKTCYRTFMQALEYVAPLDVGINNDKQCYRIALPEQSSLTKQQWYELRSMLKKWGIQSSYYRYFNQEHNAFYTGLHLSTVYTDTSSSLNALIEVLTFLKKTPIELTFKREFDKAVGSSLVREYVQGKIEWQEFETQVNKKLKLFFNKATTAFIYKPFPRLLMV